MATSALISTTTPTTPFLSPSTFSTQVVPPSSTVTDPAFVGYVSVNYVDLTTIYSSADCPSPSTFFASGYFATCCAGPCDLFTACYSSTILTGSAGTQLCTGTSTCKMDYIYQTSGVWEATTALYCAASFVPPTSYFRAQPTDGILSSNTSAVAAANSNQSLDPLPIGLGGGIGGFVGLIIFGGLLYCFCRCLGCCGGSSGGYGSSGKSRPKRPRYEPPSYPDPDPYPGRDDEEERRQRQREDDEERRRRDRDDYDQAERERQQAQDDYNRQMAQDEYDRQKAQDEYDSQNQYNNQSYN